MIVADIYARHTRGIVRVLLVTWFGLIAVSTMLTWQHHLVDILIVAAAIRDALGPYAATDNNPGGGAGFFTPGELKPYTVLYGDDIEAESFATLDEAVAEAAAFRRQAEREQDRGTNRQ